MTLKTVIRKNRSNVAVKLDLTTKRSVSENKYGKKEFAGLDQNWHCTHGFGSRHILTGWGQDLIKLMEIYYSIIQQLDILEFC